MFFFMCFIITGATVDGNSHEPKFFFDSAGRMSNNGKCRWTKLELVVNK